MIAVLEPVFHRHPYYQHCLLYYMPEGSVDRCVHEQCLVECKKQKAKHNDYIYIFIYALCIQCVINTCVYVRTLDLSRSGIY